MMPQNAPRQRYGHAMAYDLTSRRVVLFGGEDGFTGAITDTWVWDGVNWALQSPAVSAPGRREHAMAYDPVSQKVLMFGGFSFVGRWHNDTWSWDGVTWTQLMPSNTPQNRRLTPLTLGPGGRLMLFGGGNQTIHFADTWQWSGIDWVLLTPPASPPAREAHGLAYDSNRDRAVLFGGYSQGGGGRSLADTGEWDGVTWVQRLPAMSPSPRTSFDMVSIVLHGKVMLFAGVDNRPVLSDTWEYETVASYAPYGNGCQGSTSTVPLLSAVGLPITSRTFTANLSAARPRTVSLLMTGLQQANLNLGPLGAPGCTALTNPLLWLAVVTDAAGAASIPFTLPNDPSLAGGVFFQQYAVFDTPANALGVVTTAGARGAIAGL
jgi:hypothetical protein